MPLPSMTVPTYDFELPSTGEKINYRPFLVKEQKLMLIAQEGGDEKEALEAIKQILENCCLNPDIKINELPLFDIEFFFLQLRSKSVGEKVQLYFRHQLCPKNDGQPSNTQTEIEVDLNEVKVQTDPSHNKKIDLNDGVGMIMKYPKVDSLANIDFKNQDNLDGIIKFIGNCIEKIYDKNEMYTQQDYTPEELNEFITNLTEDQFNKIQNFFDTSPKIKHLVNFKCADCGIEDKLEVEGIQSFFI
tara:strand:- start:974 stop:1708 length:735 start_codon:yes stop_codon:yes gene_type:complete